MPQNNDTYNPQQIDFSGCTLINFRGSEVDITELVSEINIYHDLMASGMECEIVITDSLGVNELLPLVGDEGLVIKFKTPTFKESRTYVFRVYNVSKKNRTNQRTDIYIIKGCSQECINNVRSSINQSYRNVKASEFVRSVYNEHLKPQFDDHIVVKTDKKLHIQDSEQGHHFVFTGENPIDAINYAAREARAKKGGNIVRYNYNDVQDNSEPAYEDALDASQASNFLWYESYDGWYFREIDSLLTQKYTVGVAGGKPTAPREVFDEFYLAATDLDPESTDPISPYQKVIDVKVVKQFDTLENIKRGQYQHTVEVIDPILKKFEVQTFEYDKSADKFRHVEKRNDRRIFSDNSIFKDKVDTSHSFYFVSHIGENYVKSNAYLNANLGDNDPQISNFRKLQNWFSFDYVSRLQLNNVVLSVTIPGNTDLDIGSVINLHIPQVTQVERYLEKVNLLYDKRFFVLAVRHTIDLGEGNYYTTFECVKDTYATAIQEAGAKL